MAPKAKRAGIGIWHSKVEGLPAEQGPTLYLCSAAFICTLRARLARRPCGGFRWARRGSSTGCAARSAYSYDPVLYRGQDGTSPRSTPP